MTEEWRLAAWYDEHGEDTDYSLIRHNNVDVAQQVPNAYAERIVRVPEMEAALRMCDAMFKWLEDPRGWLERPGGEPIKSYEFHGERLRDVIARALAQPDIEGSEGP